VYDTILPRAVESPEENAKKVEDSRCPTIAASDGVQTRSGSSSLARNGGRSFFRALAATPGHRAIF
jgi:hypothetical protein